jgi:murein DD-endopeptidase MepM/ murein hydrolase activator NlpD
MLLFVTLLLSLGPGIHSSRRVWASPNPNQPGWRTYTDARYGYSLEYPADWTIIPRDDRESTYGGVLAFIPQSPSADLVSTPQIVVGLYTVERNADQSLTQWATQYQQMSSGFAPSEIKIDKAELVPLSSADGQEGLVVIGSSPLTRFRFTNIPRGRAVWFVWTNAMDEYGPVYERMVNSFQFGKMLPRTLTEMPDVSWQSKETLSFPAQPAIAPLGSDPAGYRLPFTGQKTITAGPGCYYTHQGSSAEAIDYSMTLNTPVKATYGGQVVFAGWDNTGYGNLMQIYHTGGYYSWYAHLNSFAVYYQQVGKGQVVAYSGSTGSSSGPHLHFEVRTNNQSVWIRTLPDTTWHSGDPDSPCWTGNDGYATGP